MADTVKKRLREKEYEFVIGEHVGVNGTFFDDPKQPPEDRYSASCSRAFGIVARKVGTASYTIDFEDGSHTIVPGREIHTVPKTNPNRVTTSSTSRSEEDLFSSDSDDDYVPLAPGEEVDISEEESNDNDAQVEEQLSDAEATVATEEVEQQGELKQSEEVYLTYKGKDIFKATYDKEGDQVHFQTIDEHHGRFFITKVLHNAGVWTKFDTDLHQNGTAILWKLDGIRRMMRIPFSQLGTEATYPTPLPMRKKKRDVRKWQESKRKEAINSGKEYQWKKRKGVNKKCGKERRVQPRCATNDEGVSTCKQSCKEISDEDREKVHKNFWELGSVHAQRAFITEHVKAVEKARTRKRRSEVKTDSQAKRRKTENGDEENQPEPTPSTSNEDYKKRNRQYVRKYTFTVNKKKMNVCQKFFLNTLHVDEKRVRTALNTMTDTGTAQPDKRGAHLNHYTVEEREKPVIDHICKFKTVESHYVRQTAKCHYLPSELTVQEMHRMYVAEHTGDAKVENYDFYNRVFRERFNLKFHKNKKDTCDKCQNYDNTPEEQRTEEQIAEHDLHLDEKENARQVKECKKEEGQKKEVMTAAFDLEKVLLSPYGQTSSFYYSKRLKVHNFTVTDIQDMLTLCYVWHEGEANKGSAEIGSSLQDFLKWAVKKGAKIVNLFADRCGGQNSNRMVILALHEMFLTLGLDHLGMNFLVTGHSENENDNAHSLIERKTRKRTLYTPQEWKTAIKMSFTKPDSVDVKSLHTDDVIDFHSVTNFPEYAPMLKDTLRENDAVTTKKEGKVYWSKVMQYYFTKSSPNKMFFKYHYSCPEFKYTTIHKKVSTRSQSAPKRSKMYSQPPGIDKSKKDALLKLCKENLIPKEHWKFYQDLKVKTTGDDEESESEEEEENE